MHKYLSSKLIRATFLAILGLGLSYHLATKRGLIPSLSQLLALTTPIHCPADARLHTQPTAALNSDRPLATLLPPHFDRSKVSILIEKSHHRLTLYYDQKPLKSYAVVFGNPQGDKRQEGDKKTPEGILKIQDKYPHPDWSKFLWLDYPNPQSECKHHQAKQQGKIPLFSTIGSEVGIHGVPIGSDHWVDQRINWTWGCPALKTQDINELYGVVQIGTIVEILA
ncbi:L,D-transpeptidase family protein [Alkalinema pantanalense CENA528]|uniref:L,D-transpeptidase family protein n=1 Tax=Alkalinema pantanalense TaxID=1620705 RepID=UPI003D6E9823